MDLFSSLRWHCLPLLPADDVVAARLIVVCTIFRIHCTKHSISLLTSLVYTGQVKEKYKATIHTGLRSAPELATKLLSNAVGDRLARQCVDRSMSEQWRAVEGLCGDLRASSHSTASSRVIHGTPLSAVVSDSLRFLERLFDRLV